MGSGQYVYEQLGRAVVYGVGGGYEFAWGWGACWKELVVVVGGGRLTLAFFQFSLKQKIWDAARMTIGEWTGEELTQCSLYVGVEWQKLYGGSFLNSLFRQVRDSRVQGRIHSIAAR